jgi:hypothetical protein
MERSTSTGTGSATAADRLVRRDLLLLRLEVGRQRRANRSAGSAARAGQRPTRSTR